MECFDGKLDQRIADDIRSFTRTSLDFLITIVTAIIDLFSFSAILFQIYPGLFGAILVYAAAGNVLCSVLCKDDLTILVCKAHSSPQRLVRLWLD
jgi:ABC-type uncharacterized transport system fused permease/ATPase subunit